MHFWWSLAPQLKFAREQTAWGLLTSLHMQFPFLLQFGPPIVIGSVAGSKVNYFVPSWIPKALVLLVLTPATWRMVQKAKLLW